MDVCSCSANPAEPASFRSCFAGDSLVSRNKRRIRSSHFFCPKRIRSFAFLFSKEEGPGRHPISLATVSPAHASGFWIGYVRLGATKIGMVLER